MRALTGQMKSCRHPCASVRSRARGGDPVEFGLAGLHELGVGRAARDAGDVDAFGDPGARGNVDFAFDHLAIGEARHQFRDRPGIAVESGEEGVVGRKRERLAVQRRLDRADRQRAAQPAALGHFAADSSSTD